MGYNHAAAEKKFISQWRKMEEKYRQLGMTEEQIKEIYKFERESFNSDRRYYENTVELSDGKITVKKSDEAILPTDLEENWTELIEDEEKYKKVMECPRIMRKVYFMNKIQGYSQKEISLILLKPRRTIGQWIVKISEILN